MFTRAIVRLPGRNFAEGITNSGMSAPDYSLALQQHEAYCHTLEELGLTLIRLTADERHPDSPFVEDTAIVTPLVAILTHPGAPSRRGEVDTIKNALAEFYADLHSIKPPGTLDGGDVCQVDNHFFIGISTRTNEEGAAQLAQILEPFGYTSTPIDIRAIGKDSSLLHLKSGLAYLDGKRLVVHEAIANHDALKDFEILGFDPAEAYAANCLAFEKTVLIAAGHPQFETQLQQLGYRTVALDMSEFQKMDGGLSCLSLRF